MCPPFQRDDAALGQSWKYKFTALLTCTVVGRQLRLRASCAASLEMRIQSCVGYVLVLMVLSLRVSEQRCPVFQRGRAAFGPDSIHESLQLSRVGLLCRSFGCEPRVRHALKEERLIRMFRRVSIVIGPGNGVVSLR